MSEIISKLQPPRTIYLQGLGRTAGDGYGCVAALSSAGATGFTVSGEWVAQDDFAVVVLWDADNAFEHPRIAYLPDWAFDGITLSFTLTINNCMPLDAARYPVVDWPYLNLLFEDGTQQQIPLAVNATGAAPTWSLSFSFSSFNQTTIQKMWLTFAPPMAAGTFERLTFSAVITNWTVTDPNGRAPLSVAGPGSVRLEEDDTWVARTGYWEDPSVVAPAVPAWWSQGHAIRSAYSSSETRRLTILTNCQFTHDIYVGTRLDSNCGIIQATLDGGSPVTLDTYGGGFNVRRQLFSGVAAGGHTVVITITAGKNAASQGWYFYFDFLECAVRGAVPDAPAINTAFGVATDWDTNNSYNLPPARLVWAIQKLGLVGEVDHYAGVFWWMRHNDPGNVFTSWTVTFSGTLATGNLVYLHIGGSQFGYGYTTGGTLASLAADLAALVNAQSSAFWASAAGAVLTLTERSHGPDYDLSVTVDVSHSPGVSAAVVETPGTSGYTFGLDAAARPVLNQAAGDWHADYFAQLKAAGIGVTVSFSQELVRPPDNPPAAVWVQRFPDGTPVTTATGYSDLNSSQIAFGAAVQAFLAEAYTEMGALMQSAGLPVRLQFGEVGWWFDAGSSGMAFYDADTAAAAQAALGRPPHTFLTPNDSPGVSGYADANFLRARLQAYVAAIQVTVLAALPSAVFELLWPLDVNDPTVAQLLYYVNLPAPWQQRAGSGFDTFLIEGLSYGGMDYNITKAQWCAGYPFQVLGWDQAHCRYLLSWFYASCPWLKEYRSALDTQVPLLKAWAWDHLNLYGWSLPLPAEPSSVYVLSA